MSSDPVVEDEVELKFVLDERVDVPSFEELGTLGVTAEFELNALYFDTPDLALTTRNISLRRRSGGEDAGWHLKAAVPGESRKVETRAPITGARPPKILRQTLVEALGPDFAEVALVPIARIRTIRSQTPLLDPSGRVLAKICIDDVWSQVPPPSRHDGRWAEPTWRELEIELVTGSPAVLEQIALILHDLGVQDAPYGSKIASALEREGLLPSPTPTMSEGASVWDYAATQVGVIQSLEESVRQGSEGAVHRTRVAARRLRSTLVTFAPVFDPEMAGPLEVELRWLGAVLSEARDAQVLSAHLARASLDSHLRRKRHRAVAHARDVLDTPHFEIMHDMLAEFASPATRNQVVNTPDGWAVPALARTLGVAAARYVRAAEPGNSGVNTDEEHIHLWHSLRKSAKRVRYGFEALSEIYPEFAPLGAAAWEQVTTTLGTLQDSAVAVEFLDSLSAREGEYSRAGAVRASERDLQIELIHLSVPLVDYALTLSVFGAK